ncbi:MAG: TerC family protein [Sphingomonadales bacterium]|nr:TerC family protein [Sphingomonadales bacterium]
MEWFAALATLTVLEIVLGIDNIIFITLLTRHVSGNEGKKLRRSGLALALVFRLIMLMGFSFLMGLNQVLVEVDGQSYSIRDSILMLGGVFLLAKSTMELHKKVNNPYHLKDETEETAIPKTDRHSWILAQIVLIDFIFSVDSILTAIGLSNELWLMITAVVLSMAVMAWLAEPIQKFVTTHPGMQILAMAFLMLIGFMLMLEGFHHELPKGYLYFALSFSLTVELLRQRWERKSDSSV